MNLRVSQLLHTHFHDGELRTVFSSQVPLDIQQAFTQQIVNQYWDSNHPHDPEYQAVYLLQITPQDTLFGWVYSEEEESEPQPFPYFISYHLHQNIDRILLECLFSCLAQGPATWIDRHEPPETLETLKLLDFAAYKPARSGVVIPQDIQAESFGGLARKELLNLFVPSLGSLERSLQPPPKSSHAFGQLKRRQNSLYLPHRPKAGIAMATITIGLMATGGLSLMLYQRNRTATPPLTATSDPSSNSLPAPNLPMSDLRRLLSSPPVTPTPKPTPVSPTVIPPRHSLTGTALPPTPTQPTPRIVKTSPKSPQLKPNSRSSPSYDSVFVPANDNAVGLPFSPTSKVSFTRTPTIVLKPSAVEPSSTVPPSPIPSSPRQQSPSATAATLPSPPPSSPSAVSPNQESGKPTPSQVNSASRATAPTSQPQPQVSSPQAAPRSTNLQSRLGKPRKITTHDIANAIIRGLVIADRNGEVPYWSHQYLQVQDVVYRLRLGQNRHYAAKRSGVSQALIEKLLTWGGLPPAKPRADSREKINNPLG